MHEVADFQEAVKTVDWEYAATIARSVEYEAWAAKLVGKEEEINVLLGETLDLILGNLLEAFKQPTEDGLASYLDRLTKSKGGKVWDENAY